MILRLRKLDQYATSGFRMHEGDALVVRANAGRFVDELHALSFQLRKMSIDVLYF